MSAQGDVGQQRTTRDDTISALARSVEAAAPAGRALVAIDGVGASGKTTLAGELAAAVRTRAVATIHADDFFHPPEVRHRRGRYSPEGFWLDTYDYPRIIAATRGGVTGGLLLVEGAFLHRRELRAHWDYSIFLDVPIAEAARRMHARAGAALDERLIARYVGAQRIYFREDEPWRRASVVLDNTEPHRLRPTAPSRSAAATDHACHGQLPEP